MGFLKDNWNEALLLTLGILIVRALPFIGYVLVTDKVSIRNKIVAVLVLSILTSSRYGLGHDNFDLRIKILVYGYFTIIAISVYYFSKWVAYANPTALINFPVFLLFALFFTYLPSFFVSYSHKSLIVVPGWEMMLSAYSYYYECGRKRVRSGLSDCCFFILVNPVLVYSERGQRIGGISNTYADLIRISIGVLSVVLYTIVVAFGVLAVIRQTGLRIGNPYVVLLLTASGVFLSEYSVHSGTASIQIGIMRLLGFQIPERYRYPFLATSPRDFWNRWNMYVGSWIKRYVFIPLTFKLRRKIGKGSLSTFSLALSMMITFFVVGILHDAFFGAYGYSFRFGTTKLFLASGAILIVWRGIEVRLRKVGDRLKTLQSSRIESVKWSFRNMVFIHIAFVIIHFTIG